MTVQQLIELMQRQTWRLEKVENDVRHFSHDSIPQPVTISGKLELLVPPGTLRVILRCIRLEDSGDALRGDL